MDKLTPVTHVNTIAELKNSTIRGVMTGMTGGAASTFADGRSSDWNRNGFSVVSWSY